LRNTSVQKQHRSRQESIAQYFSTETTPFTAGKYCAILQNRNNTAHGRKVLRNISVQKQHRSRQESIAQYFSTETTPLTAGTSTEQTGIT